MWNSNSRLPCTHVTDGTCARSMASSKIIPFFSCSSVSVLQNINQGSAGMDSVQGIKTQSCYPGLGGAIYELTPNLAFPYGSVFSPACPQQTSLNYPEGVRKDMVCLILSHIFKLGLHIGAQNPHNLQAQVLLSIFLPCFLNSKIMLFKTLLITARPVPKPLIWDKYKMLILLTAWILA